MNKAYLLKLAQLGYSIIPVREDKRPLGAWKQYQDKPRSEAEVSLLNSPLFGLVCGVDGLEVVDIDLKVFGSLKEQQEFWGEYIKFLRDNIDEFDKKFVVKKTKNKGFHILYKCSTPAGNTKIAKLEGHTEAIIETRGIGGMVVLYEDSFDGKNYHDIQSVSDEDREILWGCSRIYNHIQEEIKPEKKSATNSESAENEILAFDDYNEKTDIFDIIDDEFDIVDNLSKHYIIKRLGAKSSHSGYVYKDSGCMYLFSTGTIYPHETLISPAAAYTFKNHNGDFKSSSLDLYKQGFGSRSKKLIKEIEKSVPKVEDVIQEYHIDKNSLEFPIDIFPDPIQSYIIECNKKLDSNIDYMGMAMLWTMSVIIGNTINIQVKKGWTENATLWIAVVGKAGIGKTPSINNMLFPLEKINSREIKRYLKEREQYDFYEGLSKKEKDDYPEVKKPKKTQFIANDITIEALVDLHQDSDNAVGVFKDELAGWLKDMNKYRAGSDLEFWLSSWSGKSVNLNRLTRPGSFVERPFMPVLGGIQPNIFNSFYTDENKDNGFMDRMLLSYPSAIVDKYNEAELSGDLLEWYKESIIYMYDQVKSKMERDNDDVVVPLICTMDADAKTEWARIFNTITDLQNNEDENEYLKSMYPKQKSYIPRFALILNTLHSFFTDGMDVLTASKDMILKAERLSNYFIANAKKIKIDSIEKDDIRAVTKKMDNNIDKIKAIYERDSNFNKPKVAEILGVSVQYVRRIAKQLEKNETKGN